MSKDNNNGAQQSGKKQSNILNYAVVMIICVIIIIIVAAMADDREDQIDDRIIETERANENIQKEIVFSRMRTISSQSRLKKIRL